MSVGCSAAHAGRISLKYDTGGIHENLFQKSITFYIRHFTLTKVSFIVAVDIKSPYNRCLPVTWYQIWELRRHKHYAKALRCYVKRVCLKNKSRLYVFEFQVDIKLTYLSRTLHLPKSVCSIFKCEAVIR